MKETAPISFAASQLDESRHVAANQLLLASQEAQMRLEQTRLTEDFNRRVAERTAELATINATLRKEIGERRNAEAQLRENEALLREAQRLSHAGSWKHDLASALVSIGPELAGILAIAPHEHTMPLEAFLARIHPEDRERQTGNYVTALRGNRDFDSTFRVSLPDGSLKHIHARARPWLNEGGEMLGFLGVAMDVTQRRASEEALSAARAELTNVARMTSLGVLTAAIAHEVNQPISGIITNASTCVRMLSAQPPNIGGALETARRTIRDGNRAADVIARLRTLYTRKGVRPEPMDLNDAAQEVVALSLSELQRNGMILRHELADDLPLVSGDRIQLQQVILNLLRNASDAMKTIDDRPRDLLIRTEPDEADSVRLSVCDAGVGFTAQAAEKMFTPFHTTKSDGMGIGLSVSRSIIEAHRGRLWATPNHGPGVTFAFSLPIDSALARD